MTTPFWCLLVAVILPYLIAVTTGLLKYRQFGGVDIKYPRTQAAQLEGMGARAVAAQENAWEALGIFTAAVVVAHLAGADAAKSALAAEIFIVARILHAIAYLANLGPIRSLVFLVSLGCVIRLFVLAAQA